MSDSRLGGANPAPERIIRAIISGRVQGVGFRAWTQAEAEALGLQGLGAQPHRAATSKPSSPVRRRPSRRCPGASGAGRRRRGSIA